MINCNEPAGSVEARRRRGGRSLAAEAQPVRRAFDAHQLATVAALATAIIPRTDTPGAADAKVHVYLDKILAAGPQRARQSFLDGLLWLDTYCRSAFQQPFRELPEARQVEILNRLNGKPDAALKVGQSFFRSVKQWTSRIYFSTEAGFQELKKSGPPPPSYGCTHEAHK